MPKHPHLLFLLHGRAGVGKDVAAAYLESKHGFVRESYATSLKRALCVIFNVPYPDFYDAEAKGQPLAPPWQTMTPRSLMQSFGADLVRNNWDADVWVKSLAGRVARMAPVPQRLVVSDVRFANEMTLAKWLPGGPDAWKTVTVEIVRPCAGPAVGGIPGHVSEKPLTCGRTVMNDGSLENLREYFDALVEDYRPAGS